LICLFVFCLFCLFLFADPLFYLLCFVCFVYLFACFLRFLLGFCLFVCLFVCCFVLFVLLFLVFSCLFLFVFFTLLALILPIHLITLEQDSSESNGGEDKSGGERSPRDQDEEEEAAPGAGNRFIYCAKVLGQDKGQQAVIAPLLPALVAKLQPVKDSETVVFVQNLPSLTAGRKARGAIYAVPGWLSPVVQWAEETATTYVLYGKGSDLSQVCSAILL